MRPAWAADQEISFAPLEKTAKHPWCHGPATLFSYRVHRQHSTHAQLKPDNPASKLSDLNSALGKSNRTVSGLLKMRVDVSAGAPALWTLRDSSGWQSMTWCQFSDAVASAARGLWALGLKRGDRIGIIAPSSPKWDIAQFAAMAVGGVVVGLDPHDTELRLANIAAQCKLTGVIAQNEGLLNKLGSACRGSLRFALTFASPDTAGPVEFASLAKIGSAASEVGPELPLPEHEALIVFTSGTTGEPRPIVYTHEQVCVAVTSILEAFSDIVLGSRLVCWLPLSNLFQRMINICAVGRGAQIFYVEDPGAVMQHVAVISPHLFIGVPRFYEKLYAGIRETIDAKPAWKRNLAYWALRAGERRASALRNGTVLSGLDRLRATLAELLVLRRIRSVFGEHLHYLISGSAPMPVWLLEKLHALGLLVLEGYGMSESVVPVAANRPDRYRFGTVGQPLSGTEVRLATDGELLLRGPGVFTGYLNEQTSSDRLDVDGFLSSGDFASIDAEGFVSLHARKSEMFKTSTGRRIAPALTEGHLRQILYVEYAVAFGANRPFLISVVAASEVALRKRLGDWAADADPEATAAAVRADIMAAVTDLPGYQRPAGVVLTIRPFSVAGGQITPNLKVRRDSVEVAFSKSLDTMFDLIAEGPAAPFVYVREGGAVMLLSI
jgi:long-chain acyl-CoA synthetase